MHRDAGLQTGQAVLYKSSNGETLIRGLDLGKIYFVSADFDSGSNKTTIQFFANQAEIDKLGNRFFNKADAIELSAPAVTDNTIRHQLFDVVRADGGKNVDSLVAPINNDASALLGQSGNDVLVGSAVKKSPRHSIASGKTSTNVAARIWNSSSSSW